MLFVRLDHLGNEEGSSHSKEQLLADPHEDNEAENKNIGKGATLKSCWHDVIEVWSGDLSSCILVHLDWSLDELTSDLLVFVSWVVDSCVKELVNLHETEKWDNNEHNVGEALTGNIGDHCHDEAIGVVDPDEVVHLIEALVQKDTLEKDFHCGISLELRQHLDHVEKHEEDELGGVDQIPEVLEVIESLFLQLDQFEKDEENLGEEAHSVRHIEQHQVVSGQRENERHHES